MTKGFVFILTWDVNERDGERDDRGGEMIVGVVVSGCALCL